MQSVNKNGIFGEIQEYDQNELEKLLHNPEVDRVEFFKGSKENIEKRKSMVGKKYKISRAYKKAPSVNPKNNKRVKKVSQTYKHLTAKSKSETDTDTKN